MWHICHTYILHCDIYVLNNTVNTYTCGIYVLTHICVCIYLWVCSISFYVTRNIEYYTINALCTRTRQRVSLTCLSYALPTQSDTRVSWLDLRLTLRLASYSKTYVSAWNASIAFAHAYAYRRAHASARARARAHAREPGLRVCGFALRSALSRLLVAFDNRSVFYLRNRSLNFDIVV
jgi:hypothetical protein